LRLSQLPASKKQDTSYKLQTNSKPQPPKHQTFPTTCLPAGTAQTNNGQRSDKMQ